MRLGMKCKRKRHIVVFVIIPVFLCVSHFFLKRAEPSFVAQTSNYSNTAFTDLVNKCVLNIVDKPEYKDLYKIVSQDGIKTLSANTSQINTIQSKLLIDIQNTLNADYPATVKIPLGSLSSYYLLSSFGPEIPVKIIPISIVSGDFKEEFKSVGINQVRHKLFLEVSVNMQYRGFTMNETEKIVAQIPIAETVIVGDVPQYYGTGDLEISKD